MESKRGVAGHKESVGCDVTAVASLKGLQCSNFPRKRKCLATLKGEVFSVKSRLFVCILTGVFIHFLGISDLRLIITSGTVAREVRMGLMDQKNIREIA